jgi:hypothetical protein
MTFATTLDMVDRDFPGHYLRLISRVGVAVVALIPSTEGIRATLSTIGLSRVVVGANDVFQTAVVNIGPQTIALSSPVGSSNTAGQLEQQPELRSPFEGMGFAASYEWRMPKAANLIDYRSIADVLLTFDYTAFDSLVLRQQVVQELNQREAETRQRGFRFRDQFADQWFDLHNPEQTATPMTVRFTTRREDFPPNLEDLKIENVTFYFARAASTSSEVLVSPLHFTAKGSLWPVGGGASTIDGLVSAHQGDAASWIPMIGLSPVGEWELALADTPEMRSRFGDQEVEDMLFIITYSSRTPEWPV